MDKIALIQSVLDHYYPSPPVPLNNVNVFTFLVAVVLSAQTTDGKVNEVTKELFKHADTPQKMADLNIDFILKIIQPVGLAPKKANYVHQLSTMLVDKFDSKVPNTYAELESLPGVGHKTASVIMSQAFNVPSIAVDTHVHRLALRWGLSKDEKNVDNVQKDLCKLFPENCWNKLHLQMIYFGREYCAAKGHQNTECPMCSWVHRKDGRPPPHYHHFQSKTPVKGIVYYADRVRELLGDPSLSIYQSPSPTPTKSKSKSKTTAVLVKSELQADAGHVAKLVGMDIEAAEPSAPPPSTESVAVPAAVVAVATVAARKRKVAGGTVALSTSGEATKRSTRRKPQ